jgi:hypothetical protein
MPRGRRLISPAAAAGVGLLGMMLAVVITGTVATARNTIAGVAYAASDAGPTVHSGESAPPADDRAPGATSAPTTASPSSTGAAPGSAPPARSGGGGGAPAAGPPGSVLLAHGGSANLVRREVGTDGVLPIPSAIHQATWWGAGLNDQAGATVLAGHVNWKGATGPFAELWKSKVGDPVLVVDQAGQPATYRVSQVITLAKDELATRAEELFSQDGPHRLVLVTCGGQWVGGKIGYASNQVVIAVR